MDRQEDIEIYLKRVDTRDIRGWLASMFTIESETRQGEMLDLSLGADNGVFSCKILEKAAKGGYTSVWFTENRTPWDDDLGCARAACKKFQAETRCANGGWDGQDEDAGGWIRLTSDGDEAVVNWKT